MSILATACAMAVQFADPCATVSGNGVRPDQKAFLAGAISDAELSRIYGTGLPMTGLDAMNDASRARFVDIAFNGSRTSDFTREFTDNWSVEVAAPLIAQAAADSRR